METKPISRRSLLGMLAGLFGWLIAGTAASAQQPAPPPANPDPPAEPRILSYDLVVDDVPSVITISEYDAEGRLLSTTWKDPQSPR